LTNWYNLICKSQFAALRRHAQVEPRLFSPKKNFRSCCPFPCGDRSVRLPQKLLLQPSYVSMRESLAFSPGSSSRNGYSRCPIGAQSQNVPPRSRMPHELQWHAPRAHAQAIILRLHRALAVKQKLKLHHCSLRSRRGKTISQCSLRNRDRLVTKLSRKENPIRWGGLGPWRRHRRERRRRSLVAGTRRRESVKAVSIIRLRFFRVALERPVAASRLLSCPEFGVIARLI
jgi:hypothetical protein